MKEGRIHQDSSFSLPELAGRRVTSLLEVVGLPAPDEQPILINMELDDGTWHRFFLDSTGIAIPDSPSYVRLGGMAIWGRSMTREIRWKPYVWDAPRPATSQDIAHLEQEWGVKLPHEYRKLISTNQGMTPSPCIFNVGKVEDVMSVLLTLVTDPKHQAYSIRDSYRLLKQHVSAGIHPFAMTPGSEHLCFDYRVTPEEPRIVLVTVEMNVHPVADSFPEFLARLHD